MRLDDIEKEATPFTANAQPPAARSTRFAQSLLQRSVLAADPGLAGSACGGKRKMTANRKTTITNDIARYE